MIVVAFSGDAAIFQKIDESRKGYLGFVISWGATKIVESGASYEEGCEFVWKLQPMPVQDSSLSCFKRCHHSAVFSSHIPLIFKHRRIANHLAARLLS
jgi:hypothetical protein